MGATGHRERCGERDQQGVGDTQTETRGVDAEIGVEMEGTKTW